MISCWILKGNGKHPSTNIWRYHFCWLCLKSVDESFARMVWFLEKFIHSIEIIGNRILYNEIVSSVLQHAPMRTDNVNGMSRQGEKRTADKKRLNENLWYSQ